MPEEEERREDQTRPEPNQARITLDDADQEAFKFSSKEPLLGNRWKEEGLKLKVSLSFTSIVPVIQAKRCSTCSAPCHLNLLIRPPLSSPLCSHLNLHPILPRPFTRLSGFVFPPSGTLLKLKHITSCHFFPIHSTYLHNKGSWALASTGFHPTPYTSGSCTLSPTPSSTAYSGHSRVLPQVAIHSRTWTRFLIMRIFPGLAPEKCTLIEKYTLSEWK